MRIFLIGFMGSGKTTLGRELARHLGFRFLDMDQEIELSEGMSINAIFSRKGEPYFRGLENSLLKKVVQYENIVVSTGGGLPAYRDNMEVINRHGISVYLKISPERLFRNLKDSGSERPLIKERSSGELYDYIREKLAEREKYYSMARITTEADSTDLQWLMDQIART